MTNEAQSNYFGKGNTETYDRGAFHPVNHQEFHDYGIEWTPQSIQWSIDGSVVRTLTPDQVKGDFYPQTPMQIKIGSWSGGDPQNEPGVIKWANGPTDYSNGPFDMIVESIKVQDYSTGTYYYYSDHSGSASSIRSEGGKILSGPSDNPANDVSDLPSQPTDVPTTTPRAPSNSGRIVSSTTKSTKPTTTEDGSDKETTTDNTKTTPPTTTTTTHMDYSSTGFTTSTVTSEQQLIRTGTGDVTAPRNTSSPSVTNNPQDNNSAAAGTLGERFGAPIVMAIAGMVGVGLVL